MKTNMNKVLSLILCVSMIFSTLVILASCKNDGKDKESKEDLAVIVDNGDTKYTIVRSERAKEEVVDLAVSLRLSINEKFDCNIELIPIKGIFEAVKLLKTDDT